MAKYNFEGDYSSFTERQLSFINEVVHEQDIKVKKVVFLQLGEAGDNFMGNLKRIKIEGENGNMSMIIKTAPPNEIARESYQSGLMFKNEHIIYTELLPKCDQLQKAAGVPLEEHFKYAKCYGSLSEVPNEIIILEDLNESGYSMMDKFTSLPDKYVRNFLKSFAVLHSLSYVLKSQEPEFYKQLKEDLKDHWTTFADFQIKMLKENMEPGFLEIIQNEDHKSFLKNKIADAMVLRKEMTISENDRNHTIIQHGDGWTNNILFKLEGDTLQSVMVDYQGANNNNPMSDILFMLFHCTDHEDRSKHFYDWIDYYHSEMDKFLTYFGLKVNDFYTREQLDDDLKTYAKIIFGIVILMVNVIQRDSTEAEKMKDEMQNIKNEADMAESMKAQDLTPETVDRINKKVGGLIETLHQFHLI
uniref:CHK kinase-like domain-containing protein n=1 Tax=Heliothis virescens TaxID=7102 RepID=A0A2A4JD29_HELVI